MANSGTKFIEYNVDLTHREIEQLGEELATLTMEIVHLENEKSETSKRLNEVIKEKDAVRRARASLVKQGYRVHSVECRLQINHDDRVREWVSLDTGEIMKVEPLEAGDDQLVLIKHEGEVTKVDLTDAETSDEDDANFFDDDPEEGSEEDFPVDPEEFNEGMRSAETAAEELMEEEASAEDEDPAPEQEDEDEEEAQVDKDDVFGMDEPEETEPELPPLGWNLTEAHVSVLDTVDANPNTEIDFSDDDKPIRAAAEFLVNMGYLEGEGHKSITGLTDEGRDLYDNYVAG